MQQQNMSFGQIAVDAGSSVAETEASKYKELVHIQGLPGGPGGATSARTTGALQQMKAYGLQQTGYFGSSGQGSKPG